jgi:predicted Rossmann fold flavoprotein
VYRRFSMESATLLFMTSVGVIGGGPAGFMAAISAAAPGGIPAAERAEVTVLDAGIPLATLLRTGGGRCNLANVSFEGRELAAQYPRGGKFLLSAFARFGPREAVDWFQSRGCAVVLEDEGRVFPRSGKAQEVRALLEDEARRLDVRVRARAPVTSVAPVEAGFSLQTPRGAEGFDRIIIATGGDWNDREGSGYRLARSLGHTITPLAPSLSALVAAESWPGTLAGLTLHGARVSATFEGSRVSEEQGDLLFTHTGISGPLAFRISSRSAFLPFSPQAPVRLQLTALPAMNAEEIEAFLLDAIASRPRQQVASAIRLLLPRSLADVVLALAGVVPDLVGAQLGREKRKAIARLMDRLPITVIGRKKGEEMVTAGGVTLAEVDPRTMESRLVPGLYFCGEVLDIDGFTGGFNLLAAWSTGRLAGLAGGG